VFHLSLLIFFSSDRLFCLSSLALSFPFMQSLLVLHFFCMCAHNFCL
jgi:hypothetical protein